MQLPLVVPKTRTRTIGGQATISETHTIGIDVTTQGLADVHQILIQTIAETTADQKAKGNEPNFVLVDGRDNKKVTDAKYKVEVFYGAFLPRALMSAIEIELHRAITQTQSPDKYNAKRRTGALANIRANWQWTLNSKGKRTALGGPQDVKTFGPGDVLILSPTLFYAGRANTFTTQRIGHGFMFAAIDKLRRKNTWRAFQINVGFSQKFALPGELNTKQGTPFIEIKMARGRYARRR